MAILAKQVFETTDGKQFGSEGEALAHQTMLDNADIIDAFAESFVNITSAPGKKEVGLVGRTRAFNKNVASQMVSYLLSVGAMLPDDFEPVQPSEELQARIDADAAEVAAKLAEKKAKEGKAEVVAEDADAPEDLFAE